MFHGMACVWSCTKMYDEWRCCDMKAKYNRFIFTLSLPLLTPHFVSKSLYVDEDSTAKNLYFSIIFSERLDYECDLPWTPGKCRTDQSKTSHFSKRIFSKVWSLENRTFWRRFYIFHPPGRVENVQLFENNIDTHHKQNPVVESSI